MARTKQHSGGEGFGSSSSAQSKRERQLEQIAQRSLLAGDWQGAESTYRLLVRSHSTNPRVYANLAAILAMQERTDELEGFLRKVIALDPTDPVARNNLGQVLVQQGALDEAKACFMSAVALDPAYPQALTNLANLLCQVGSLTDGIAFFKQALEADPAYAEARWNLAHPLLLQGDYCRGLELYEYRNEIRKPIQPHAIPPLPRWEGSVLPEGSPLVLVSEQGLGDTLQFMRLASLAQQRQACPVWLSVQDKLAPLAMNSALADRVLPHAELAQLRQGQWLPLMSLPLRLGIKPTQPLPPLPLLKPSTQARQRWKTALIEAADSGSIRVGIHWQGDPAHETTNLRGRSLPLELLAPLAAIPELTLVSLQRGPGADQLEHCGFRERFSRAQGALDAAWHFDDMAAIAEQCHLVISADSAMVHLAAGLGRPTWVLLKAIPEWRWGLEGSGSFWYPSVRLWRQTVTGDWAGLIASVAANLRAQIRSGEIAPC